MRLRWWLYLPIIGVFAFASQAIAAEQRASIVWDEQTLVLIERGAVYGRMLRLADGRILCCYQKARQVWVETSSDNGRHWNDKAVRVAGSAVGVAANPELLLLQSGTLLCFFNERPRDGRHRFAILVCTSHDGGATWSAPRRLYEAGTEFENGCWEPAAIQLPDGEIQLFFANEGPYRQSSEQEITMLRCRDDGQTWSEPTTVSFRPGHRDGMPVPLLLRCNPPGIAVAIEDNGISGTFKPAIIYSSLSDNWRHAPVGADSPFRWRALRTPLDPQVYAGAPYLRQMPSGEVLLSFQCTEGSRRRPWMVVYVGNRRCRDFQNRSVPFAVGPDVACLWNSLFVKSDHVITAVSSTTLRGVRGLWAIDGRIVNAGTSLSPRNSP